MSCMCLLSFECHSLTLQAPTGQVPDISHILHFSFWEPVYCKVDENDADHRFPSQSKEKSRHWVGFADNKGDHLTWNILTINKLGIWLNSVSRVLDHTLSISIVCN